MSDEFAGLELSGDGRLSVRQRLTYLWTNLRRNLRGSHVLRASVFIPDLGPGDNSTASPGRALTDAFLAGELIDLLPGQGRRPLDVLELGCGSGSLCRRLAAIGLRGRYTGVDIDDRFDRSVVDGFSKTFIQERAGEVDARAYDLVISVSALEHFPEDWRLARALRAQAKDGSVEVHVVPSGAALCAYLWHGYRQYSLARIEHVFGTAGVSVVRLGGFCSLIVHICVVTIPEICLRVRVRDRWAGGYRKLRRLALGGDRAAPFWGPMYVVVRRH